MFGYNNADEAWKHINNPEHKWVMNLQKLVGKGVTGDYMDGEIPSVVKVLTKDSNGSWAQHLLHILESIQKELYDP